MNGKDTGLLVLRLTAGGLLVGHGAQKLFGAFGGHGLEGTAGFMESLGLEPGEQWAALAGLSEFGGGALTALGLLHPLGPVGMAAAMTMATRTAHAGKPIWVTAGGAELPVTNIAIALALTLAGPGAYSVDEVLGFHLPRPVAALAAAAAAAGIYLGLSQAQPAHEAPPADEEAAPAPDTAPDHQPPLERQNGAQRLEPAHTATA